MNRYKHTRITIEKKDSSTSSDEQKDNDKYDESIFSESESKSESESESKSESESESENRFVSIVNSGYKKSKYGSKQDHMTGYDMVHK